MISWPDLFLPTTISNHIAFPRPPINDFSQLINYAICVAMRFCSSYCIAVIISYR